METLLKEVSSRVIRKTFIERFIVLSPRFRGQILSGERPADRNNERETTSG
jgi:hypothetical protein